MNELAKSILNPTTPMVQVDESDPSQTIVKIIHAKQEKICQINSMSVIQVMPVWAPMDTSVALTGATRSMIIMLAGNGKIRAKKQTAEKNSKALFRIADILECIDEMSDYREVNSK